ncbi:MAG: hypothetical protein JW881_00525 [Spirochaetales bacterium]|nr:hypothetical protein [Spirochaetales bacterium]
MKELYSRIKNETKDFIAVEQINDFISLISPWEEEIDNYFFQFTGTAELPTLEFGCHAGNVLLDITFSEKTSKVNVLSLHFVDWVQLTETSENVELSINCSGNRAFYYQAQTPETRQQLKDYGMAIASITGNMEKWGGRHSSG